VDVRDPSRSERGSRRGIDIVGNLSSDREKGPALIAEGGGSKGRGKGAGREKTSRSGGGAVFLFSEGNSDSEKGGEGKPLNWEENVFYYERCLSGERGESTSRKEAQPSTAGGVR